MKYHKHIKLNAALLLAIFTLNTVICFACAVGSSFNLTAHCDKMSATQSAGHMHKHDKSQNEQLAEKHKDPGNTNHDCCKKQVEYFIKLDKLTPAKFIIDPVFVAAFYTSYLHLNLALDADAPKDVKLFVRNYHPPIPSIRIAIQSFQI